MSSNYVLGANLVGFPETTRCSASQAPRWRPSLPSRQEVWRGPKAGWRVRMGGKGCTFNIGDSFSAQNTFFPGVAAATSPQQSRCGDSSRYHSASK